MIPTYLKFAKIALEEFDDIISETRFIGGTPSSPNKLRLLLREGSFLDIWLSFDGDYSYHWERRAQTGEIFRWDNAPHHAHVGTFPDHFHQGNEQTIVDSYLNSTLELAFREVIKFIEKKIL